MISTNEGGRQPTSFFPASGLWDILHRSMHTFNAKGGLLSKVIR